MNQSEIITPFDRYQNWVVKIAGNENFTTEKKPFQEISENSRTFKDNFLKYKEMQDFPGISRTVVTM